MPETRDQHTLRRILSQDPYWSVYALGDLSPGRFPHCTWYVTPEHNALLLFYRQFGTPVIFAIGEIGSLVEEAPREPELYLHVRPALIPALERYYRISRTKQMVRMALRQYQPVEVHEAERIEDAVELRSLYADGGDTGEAPDFFFDSMVDERTFFGIRREGRLVAAAGTHLAVEQEGAGAVGNVYVHREWRGRGLGRMVTSAVVEELLDRGISTIALNVYYGNAAAIRTYEKLGFVRYCEFREGHCTKR